MPPCILYVLTAVIDQLCLPLHSRLTLHLASKDRSTSRRDIAYKHVKVATCICPTGFRPGRTMLVQPSRTQGCPCGMQLQIPALLPALLLEEVKLQRP